MKLSVTRVAATSIVAATGDIDVDTGYNLYLAVIAEAEAGSSQVVLDLADITFVDSVGLGMLIRSRDDLADHHESVLTLHNPSRRVLTLLELTAMRTQFRVTHDDDEPPTVGDDAELERG